MRRILSFISPPTKINVRDHGNDGIEIELRYNILKEIGRGSMGEVYKVKTKNHGIMALKICQNEANEGSFAHEISMMSLMTHPNLISLRFSARDHIFMEYMETPLSKLIFGSERLKVPFPKILACCIMYQILRGLAFMHHRNIAHRDLKPHNILVNEEFGFVKICDFGTARQMGEGNLSNYMCCRWTRAIELLCGVKNCTVNIDLWSAGVCMLTMLSRKLLFLGATTDDQIRQIFKTLGGPDDAAREYLGRQDVACAATLDENFSHPLTDDERDFAYLLLQYVPENRGTAWTNLMAPYFDQLRAVGCQLRKGVDLPNLFRFTPEELEYTPDMMHYLRPFAIESSLSSSGRTSLRTRVKNLIFKKGKSYE